MRYKGILIEKAHLLDPETKELLPDWKGYIIEWRDKTIGFFPTVAMAKRAVDCLVPYWHPFGWVDMWGGYTFSEIATEVARIRRSEVAGYEDMRLFHAPVECYHDLARSARRQIDNMLAMVGMTRAEFNAELEDRTSGRYAYWSGLWLDE